MGPSQGMTFDEEPKEDEIIQGIYALKHLVMGQRGQGDSGERLPRTEAEHMGRGR